MVRILRDCLPQSSLSVPCKSLPIQMKRNLIMDLQGSAGPVSGAVTDSLAPPPYLPPSSTALNKSAHSLSSDTAGEQKAGCHQYALCSCRLPHKIQGTLLHCCAQVEDSCNKSLSHLIKLRRGNRWSGNAGMVTYRHLTCCRLLVLCACINSVSALFGAGTSTHTSRAAIPCSQPRYSSSRPMQPQ